MAYEFNLEVDKGSDKVFVLILEDRSYPRKFPEFGVAPKRYKQSVVNHEISAGYVDLDGEPEEHPEIINLEGYTARMQIRKTLRSEDVLDELTTSNGRMEVIYSKLYVHFPHEVTSQYSFNDAVYDIELISHDGSVSRILQGEFIAHDEVTR